MRGFQQVDVFAGPSATGNPVAVVLNAEGLSSDEMQRFARWMNLSETTFVLPPSSADADYQVRIFTLQRELPFAGHPTLGTCHAWLAAGGLPHEPDELVQECGAGLVRVRRERGQDSRLSFRAPPLLRSGPVEEDAVERIAARLRIGREEILDIQWVDNGPGWVGVLLEDAGRVLEVEPDLTPYDGDGAIDIGVVGPYPPGSPYAVEVRAIFTDGGGNLREDPVTGSLNASLAQWLLGTGRLEAPYVASQGVRTGSAGEVHIDQDDDGAVWVGGTTRTVIAGEVDL